MGKRLTKTLFLTKNRNQAGSLPWGLFPTRPLSVLGPYLGPAECSCSKKSWYVSLERIPQASYLSMLHTDQIPHLCPLISDCPGWPSAIIGLSQFSQNLLPLTSSLSHSIHRPACSSLFLLVGYTRPAVFTTPRVELDHFHLLWQSRHLLQSPEWVFLL